MQWQLERSQWWSPSALLEHQFVQMRELIGHAVSNVPLYRGTLARVGVGRAADMDPEAFRRWPILRKSELRANEEALRAMQLPPAHGAVSFTTTTGSTGEPVRIAYTEIAQFFSHALFLRDHLVHDRDFAHKLAVINSAVAPDMHPTWGMAEKAFATGPVVALHSSTDVDRQLAWLAEERPAYLISQASNLRALLLRSAAIGVRPEGIRQLVTISDMPAPDLAELAQAAWGASVAATYVSEECGPIASQCPGHSHYLVNAENVYLEVLRDDGRPCEPGETGRIVLTSLHNFAMPLIRYEIGDHAELGGPCPTGRGLPVLRRVVGRARNMARDPNGRRFWPTFPAEVWLAVAPVQKIQLVQRSLSAIEVRYEMQRPLSAAEVGRLTTALQGKLGYPFELRFVRVAAIAPGRGGKYEDFVSEVDAP